MNEEVESKDARNMREELCGCGLDAAVVTNKKNLSAASTPLQRYRIFGLGR
jgi:hypothetical protein